MRDFPSFPNINELYEARGGRWSPECDLGVWWLRGDRPYPRYRLTWIEDTGDLYIANQHTGEITVLAKIPPETFPEPPNRRFISLDGDSSRPLFGWTEHAHEPDGLSWVVQQTARWAQ